MNCVMMKKYPVEILEELCFDGGVFTDNDDDNYSLELVYKVNNDECDEMIFKDTEENKFFHVYYSEEWCLKNLNNFLNCAIMCI